MATAIASSKLLRSLSPPAPQYIAMSTFSVSNHLSTMPVASAYALSRPGVYITIPRCLCSRIKLADLLSAILSIILSIMHKHFHRSFQWGHTQLFLQDTLPAPLISRYDVIYSCAYKDKRYSFTDDFLRRCDNVQPRRNPGYAYRQEDCKYQNRDARS